MSDPDSSPAWIPPTPEELAGEFPKLEIQSLLALGGMSAVYLVRQESLDRLAVLKVLPLEVGADAEASARFQTEARALASVRDRGVVEVYDFGRTSRGYLYLLLEYEGGGDLRGWIRNRQHPVTPEEALGIGSSIAGGLAAAHRKGIIHGDIKPDNVFLDEEGHLKVGDFGLAGTDGISTATHYTPGYTAPEILAGYRQTTPQTDVYAIGATLFELLLNTTPPEEAGSLALELQKLPQPVAAVIGWALQVDPAARPATALEYRSALENAAQKLREETASAGKGPRPVFSPPGTPPRPARPAPAGKPSSGPRPLLIAAGLAALLAVGYFATRPAPPPAVPDPAIAETPPAIAESPPPLAVPSPPVAAVETPATPSEMPTAEVPTTPLPVPPEIAAAPPGSPGKPGDKSDEAWLEEGTVPLGTTPPGTTPPPVPEPIPEGPATEADIAAWNPDWIIHAPRGGEAGSAPRFSSTLEDGNRVLVLVPFSGSLPATLSRRTTLPPDRPMQLSIRVAAHEDSNADWLLKAFANDQPLSTPQIIPRRSGKRRFMTLTWDLTPWKGKPVSLRLENHAGGEHGWYFEHSYWAWLKLEPLSELLANAVFQPANASKGPVDPGFVDLFSAPQAGGWKESEAGGLSFTKGVATTYTRPGAKHKGIVWFTKRMFRDFVLQVEFKMDTLNVDSGIWLRGTDPGIDSMTAQRSESVELEIRGDTVSSTGTGSLAGEKAPTSLPLNPGDWNKYEIAVTGTRHLVKLNGVLINEWHSREASPGYLGLQHLRSDGEVQFRNVRIREISPGVAALSSPPKPPGTSPRPLGVPDDAQSFNGKWYRFYDEKMLWRMAKKRCEDLKGHLAFIPDAGTNNFIATLTGSRISWVGASDEKKEGEWTWLDGTPLGFTKWGPDQPDNGANREDFMSVVSGSWNDDSNEGHSKNVRGFVCQWD